MALGRMGVLGGRQFFLSFSRRDKAWAFCLPTHGLSTSSSLVSSGLLVRRVLEQSSSTWIAFFSVSPSAFFRQCI